MKIKKINKVKNYRIFRSFSWPASLPEFKDYNLIYGWNGSGKTVLSSIFRDIGDNRISVVDASFDVETEDRVIEVENPETATNPLSIRVFNEEFGNFSINGYKSKSLTTNGQG